MSHKFDPSSHEKLRSPERLKLQPLRARRIKRLDKDAARL
jgi:hypothetical protein